MQDTRTKSQDPLVSIIIPVYNKAPFVRETLESALQQTYPNIELVLVDDGSTDGSFEILKEYFAKYPDKTKLIDQDNQGVSAATNVGIAAAKGEYIQFLDADDLLSPNKIANQIKLLQGQSESILASCEWRLFQDDLKKSYSIPYGVFQDFKSGSDLLLRFWNKQEMHQPAVYLTPRSLIEKAGPWDETLTINQDGEFFTRVLLHAEQVLYEPEGKVYYRSPGVNNVSQQKSEKAIKSLLDSYMCYEREVLKFEDSKRVRIALKKVYQKFIYDVFPQYPDLISKAESLMQNLGVDQPTYIGGPKFQMLSKYLGFKNALRLKRLF
ncbi:glycosyltransferase family A protein [Algoriphagus halophytocola]|uniref:glycosyltransferase family 2 protein n=1 Tax=Algoriphagus halophytocola TaxID=2991499 RepID=UPI0022DD9910|nr:glycosyltransferase family A protein [Algoriphagus sp. TR-M9]WBL41302.1 glycosyltransferase family A protein [Algoriphagus sp. TR-M9]